MTIKTSPPVALITGGARRIGKALCEAFHKKGYNIIVHCHRSTEQAVALTKQLNAERKNSAHWISADLNRLDEIRDLATQAESFWGAIHILINNASSFFPTPLSSATESEWDDLINSNLKAPFFLSQQLHQALSKQRGCIINISDIFAERPMPNHSIYCIAKAGNNMLTQSLALELAPKIRVNGIAPGAILWPENAQGDEVVNLGKLSQIPLNHLGGTEAVVKAAEHFVTNEYLTGQVIRVDGGRSIFTP